MWIYVGNKSIVVYSTPRWQRLLTVEAFNTLHWMQLCNNSLSITCYHFHKKVTCYQRQEIQRLDFHSRILAFNLTDSKPSKPIEFWDSKSFKILLVKLELDDESFILPSLFASRWLQKKKKFIKQTNSTYLSEFIRIKIHQVSSI